MSTITINKNKFYIQVIGLLLMCLTCSGSLYAQTYDIYGPTTANAGETKSYVFRDSNYNNPGSGYSYFWYASGGTITESSGSVYFGFGDPDISVSWSSSGTKTITVDVDNEVSSEYYFADITVTVSGGAPSTPTAPTIQSTNCGNTVLQRGTPPSGITWYWQSSSSGTSTSNSATTITRTSGSIYYLRARNTSGTWSASSSSVSYSITQPSTWYADTDGDGLGDPNTTQSACTQPSGYVANNTDLCPTQSGTVANNGCPDCGPSDQNYVYSITPQIETTDVSLITQDDDKIESITYFDGLGRPLQSIGIRAGGNREDIITHIAFDSYGRQDKDYLPFAETTQCGLYRADALTTTNSFYNTTKYENTTNPYSEKELEASPLNRVLKQAAPGNDWALGNGNEIEFEYETNTSTDNNVRIYNVTLSFASNTYTPTLIGGTSNYPTGELYKTVTKDENHSSGNNHTTEEFKNKQGQVILKRTYESGVEHDTYYVYDGYGNLTYVLPPKMNASTTGLSTVISQLNDLGYQYVYDHRNRLVEKKIPGKGWEYIVYDNLDRPVLTQDANQRVPSTNEWLFTKYDALGRVIYTGVFDSNSSRTSLQSTFINKSAVQNYETKVTSGTGYANTYYNNSNFPYTGIDVLTVNYYDNYSFDKVSGSSETSYGVTPITNAKGLATGSKVKVLDTSDWITTVTYYDDKSRPIYVYSFNDYLNTTDKIKSDYDFVKLIETTTTHARTGFSTITNVDSFVYDHAGRLLSQTNNLNNTVSKRLVHNNYDELGQLESKFVDNGTADGYKDLVGVSLSNDELTKTASNGWNGGLATNGSFVGDGYLEYEIPQTNKALMIGLSSDNTNTSYSTIDYAIYHSTSGYTLVYESGSYKGNHGSFQAGDIMRVERIGSTIYYKKNGDVFYTSAVTSTGSLLGDGCIYHNGGKIKDLKIVDNTKGLQTVDYTYNIRGWLKEINDVSSLGSDLFGFKLNYNTQDHGANELYNGNISETEWKTANDNTLRWYKYGYDALNRITSGIDNTTNQDYKLQSITYDKNGNIASLIRRGHTVANPVAGNSSHFGTMDNLVYTYETNSNKLKKVLDNGNDTYGFKDGSNITTEYTYDANGNMLRDYNKGISSDIQYNHLNLPTQVTLGSGNISYIYDATGVKLKKIVSTGTTTEYAGNYVYEGSSLKFFNHPEGYVDAENGYDYVYQYKDHLGNVRLSYKDSDGNGSINASTEILEENNYYPFGLKHKGYNTNVTSTNIALKRKFGGKEYQDELGLDWYDFHARNYDAAIGRWMNLDPLAEDYYEWSPYNYVYNSPLKFIDPTGMGPIFDEDGNVIGYEVEDGQGPSQIAKDLTDLGIYQEGINFTDIVSLNKGKFTNVKNKEDINDEEYTKLNLNEGDIINAPSEKFGGNLIVTDDSKVAETNTTEEQFGDYELDRTNAEKLELVLEVARLITPDPLDMVLGKGMDITAPKTSRSSTRTTRRGSSTSLSSKSSSSSANSSSTRKPNSWNQFLKQTRGTYSGNGWQTRAAADYKKLKAQ